MSLFKKKQKANIIELFRDKEVIYRVTIEPDFVHLESASKTWGVWYASTTFEAGMVNYLVANKCMDELTELVRAQYLTAWMFHDAKLVTEFYRIIERSAKRMARVKDVERQNTISDAIILAEDKVMHDQTVESVNELETLKKKKKP